MTTASTLTTPTPPRVLFVGDDASSPQIAASLLRRLVGDRVAVHTAGTTAVEPGGRSDELLVAMGLDPADEQQLSARALHAADRVVVLGAGLDVARLPGPRYQEWDLSHDDLIERVQRLGDELNAVGDQGSPSVLDRLRVLLRPARRR
jgi:protein-tyrosine-phosphatase